MGSMSPSIVFTGSFTQPSAVFISCSQYLQIATLFLLLAVIKLGHFAAFAQRQKAGFGVRKKLFPRVGNVEVAHGELSDAVARRERRFRLLHAETLGMESQIGRFGVEDGVVVAPPQLKRDLASDGF